MVTSIPCKVFDTLKKWMEPLPLPPPLPPVSELWDSCQCIYSIQLSAKWFIVKWNTPKCQVNCIKIYHWLENATVSLLKYSHYGKSEKDVIYSIHFAEFDGNIIRYQLGSLKCIYSNCVHYCFVVDCLLLCYDHSNDCIGPSKDDMNRIWHEVETHNKTAWNQRHTFPDVYFCIRLTSEWTLVSQHIRTFYLYCFFTTQVSVIDFL